MSTQDQNKMPSVTYKENSQSQVNKDIKELNREKVKDTLTAKTTASALTIIAQKAQDLAADLVIKGAPSHAAECQALSDLAVEQLEALGHKDPRKEPEIEKPKQLIRQFKPVLDGGRVSDRKPTPQFRPVRKEDSTPAQAEAK